MKINKPDLCGQFETQIHVHEVLYGFLIEV